jgi:hypothetical protein
VPRFRFRLITLIVVQFALVLVLIAHLEPRSGGGGSTVHIICSDFSQTTPNQNPVTEEYGFESYGLPWRFITITTFTKGAFFGTTYEVAWLALVLDAVIWAAFALGLGYACERYVRS